VSGKVVIVENESWTSLEAARQEHLETSLRLTAGVRVGRVPALLPALRGEDAAHVGNFPVSGGEVYVNPVLLPDEEIRTLQLVKSLERAMPYKRPFGIVVLLVGRDSYPPDAFLDSFWVDVLDNLYSISIPTTVVAWQGGHPSVEGFQLAASTSSLLRELDSLEELARLAALLSGLEDKVDALSVVAGEEAIGIDRSHRTAARGKGPEDDEERT
jgi:hypothetical protein